jgi:hypothetical protein
LPSDGTWGKKGVKTPFAGNSTVSKIAVLSQLPPWILRIQGLGGQAVSIQKIFFLFRDTTAMLRGLPYSVLYHTFAPRTILRLPSYSVSEKNFPFKRASTFPQNARFHHPYPGTFSWSLLCSPCGK